MLTRGASAESGWETGELRAIMNASTITELRTAAVSAVATRLRSEASDLAIVGAGTGACSACIRIIERQEHPSDSRC